MKPKELTVRGLILGVLITTIFTAANVYLGLKVGLSKDAPLALVGEDFALGPWLGVVGFVGVIILLYGWMLRRSAATQ